MTHRLPNIPTMAVCVILGITTLAAADDADVSDGNALVAAAVESLLQHPNIEAKIRQRATILGQLMAGAGLYTQTRHQDQLLVRFEFQLQVGEKSLSVLQVNDGSNLWIRRDVGNVQSQSLVNLRRLRDALSQRSAGGEVPPRLDAGQLAVGGLAQLLKSLSDQFQFGPAKGTEVSGIPMWELSGEWKPERLLQLIPNDPSRLEGQLLNPSELPAHMPTIVKLTLGRDRNFPLFPYRVEFGRLEEIPNANAGATPVVRPLVTMELFEVRRRTDLTPDLFKFPVGDQNVEDQTDQYLKKLLPEGQPK